MGCVQQKKYQNPDMMAQRTNNQSFSSKKQLYQSFQPTSSRPDFQTAFKQNLISDLMTINETRQKQTHSISEKQKFSSPVTINKIPNLKKAQRGVSESADIFPQIEITKGKSLSVSNK